MKPYCDIVMKGGVTSGVVYPPAIVEISKTFSFKNVGGTSAGAIAAAVSAAAQLGRVRGSEAGFELLAALPDELATNELLYKLFHPNRQTAHLFDAIAALFSRKTIPEKIVSVLSAHWPASLLGTLPALVLLANSNRKWYDTACALLLGFGGALCASATAFGLDFWRGIRANNYGLVTGITDDGTNAPALTTWLEDKLRKAAGITDDSTPLTFGMLWKSSLTGPCGLPERPDAVDVNLEMVTTCVTLGRPFKFPFDTTRFYFRPDEMRRYFPAHVVDWMERWRRQPDDDDERERHRKRAELGFIPLPPIGDIPVILATRMSLSFPILFSAVPFYTVDFRLQSNRAANNPLPKLDPCWFTDGGLSSNFPISLFDAPLPRWPTFAINLGGLPPNVNPDPDQAKNVWMPPDNKSGILRQFASFDNILGYLAAIVTTMQSWGDTTQAVLPGYRDRIVTVLLSDNEGGLNLDMPPAILNDLRDRGTAAGKLIVSRFADAAGETPANRINWQNHRWLRLRTLLRALQDYLGEYDKNYELDKQQWTDLIDNPPSGTYTLPPSTRDAILKLLEDAAKVGDEIDAIAGLDKNLPKPPPQLVLRPDLSSST